ncbi:calcium/sodium antiporter [Patescibacteria group bacterium]|jgi:cation:H+ antiporter|nr:calcium/sodium antiporter [Patescibacteria group bacterium]
MFELLFWVVVFAVALGVMVKGADLFLSGAERIGLDLGFSPFVIGVFVVGVGTSLPELTSGIVALIEGAPEIVTANAVGSNVTNIFLVGGIIAVLGGKIAITRNLLDAELPFFVISTSLFLAVAFDGEVTFVEALMLAATYAVYLSYLFSTDVRGEHDLVIEAEEKVIKRERRLLKYLPHGTSFLLALAGLGALVLGAKFVVDAVVALAAILGLTTGVIAMIAIALGTSLPEVSVSVRALQTGKFAVALGNLFGSNAFNVLLAVGIPGLFATLPLGPSTFAVGVPMLAVASVIYLVIGLAQKMYRWEGVLFLILYLFFVLKLVGA